MNSQPVETVREGIACRSERIGSLMRAAELVLTMNGEPDPRKRETIALDLISCAQEYADFISDAANAMESMLHARAGGAA